MKMMMSRSAMIRSIKEKIPPNVEKLRNDLIGNENIRLGLIDLNFTIIMRY